MKRVLFLSVLLLTMILAAACNSSDEKVKEDQIEKNTSIKEEKDESKEVASLVDPRLQEPTEDTKCEMCNMKVYMKDEEMGMFSAQAIKTDGSIAFYDDIGCLLNAEVANNETNEKFVRDYHSLEWARVEDVTIVKTNLKSPMNWGYIYFVEKEEAKKYIAENEGAHIEELQTIKDLALERRKAKLKEKAEKDGENANTETEKMNMEMDHSGHNH